MSSKRAPRARSSARGTKPAISDSEIDVLKVFVRSTFSSNQLRGNTDAEVSFGEVRVNFLRQEWFRNGRLVQASVREFHLLKYFLLHEGEVLSREQLLRDVWGFEEAPETRSVDNYILTLRKKIEPDPSSPKHILTLRGAGYKFVR